MIILWTLIFLLHETLSHKVTEQLDDIPNNATTTLFPVAPRPIITNTSALNINETVNRNTNTKLNSEATVWKVETAFAESKLEKKEEENGTENEEDSDKRQNRSQEFRPSQHLGDFFDIDTIDPITFSKENFQHFTPTAKKPSEGFKGFNNSPKKYPTNAQDFPYKFDSHKDPWMPGAERAPTKGPWAADAGPLPGLSGEQTDGAGDFGLDFKGELAFKEQGVKKRGVNPWRGVMRMLTALIPTALIVSALTPSIINVEHMRKPFPTRLTRRSTPPQPQLSLQALQAPISERCRRRLLCELQAEEHYKQSSRKEQELSSTCRKHRCEDPSTLIPLITWLLQPRRRTNGAARGNKVN